MKRYNIAIRCVCLLFAAILFPGKEAFTSSWESYYKEFTGFTAGGALSLPKMVNGEDARIMTEKIEELTLAIDNNKDRITKMVEQYRLGVHPYTMARNFITLKASPDFDVSAATIITVPGKDEDYPVHVPVALHLKKNSPKIIITKAASDFVLSQVYLNAASSGSSQRIETSGEEKFMTSLRSLVWSFRPDNDDFADRHSFTSFDRPGYLVNLYENLSAVADKAMLGTIVKRTSSEKDANEPDPALTSRIIQAFLQGKGCDPEVLKEFKAYSPEIRLAYVRMIVILLPVKDWAVLLKRILPWARKNVDPNTSVLDWLKELSELR